MEKFIGVSIIIPALNETYLLRNTIEIIVETCNSDDIESLIIVLCDRSTAGCIKTAERIKKDFASLSIQLYYQNKPFIGNAYQEAFHLVTSSHVIMAAADMDMDPYAISKFIAESKRAPGSIILASRWIPGGGFQGYGRLKLALNYVSQKLLAVIFGTTLTDYTYGFRLYPSELMKSIQWEEQEHPFFLETLLKPIKLGIKCIEVPAMWKVRTEGTSAITLLRCVPYLKTAFHIRIMPKSRILKNTQSGS